MLKIAYIKRILYSCQQKVGVCFNYFWFSMMGVSMEHIVTMFQAFCKYVNCIFGDFWEKVNSVIDCMSIRRKVAKGRS